MQEVEGYGELATTPFSSELDQSTILKSSTKGCCILEADRSMHHYVLRSLKKKMSAFIMAKFRA